LKILSISFLIFMISNVNILPQSSFGLNGYSGNHSSFSSPLYNFESNVSDYSQIKDWGFSAIYGMEFANSTNSNLYGISISKTINNHNISVRYTPGYQKEFSFKTGETIILQDSTSQSLTSGFIYKELFGFGYSYKFSDDFSAGFSFRYFNQEFNREAVTVIFNDNPYLVSESTGEKINFWKGDLGINYFLNERLNFALASINLLNFGQKAENSEFEQYELKKDMGGMFGLSYHPVDETALNFVYETTNAFQLGVNGYLKNFSLGFTLFHDKYQSPSIAGIIPSIGFKSDLFEVMLSGIKYFSNRKVEHGVSGFVENGLSNIINNPYSYDKILLTVSFNLNTITEKFVEFVDVKINKDIYPTFKDNYIDYPFAYGTVVNLTDDFINVKPLSRIEGINEENIQSPGSSIAPHDTAEVPFYLIIPEKYHSDKTALSYADFYLVTTNEQPDDEFQKAILVNSSNSWDGRVSNLHYFIRKDLDFSMMNAKEILSKNKPTLDTLTYGLEDFYKANILFNSFIKNLVYTSDPRATGEYVQFPRETLELKGGDCDDLSVFYSSLLESVGIQTALVNYKTDGTIRHVSVLFNTKLSPEFARLITNNDSKYFVRENLDGKDEIWLPVETTSLTDFETAWKIGSEKFNKDAVNNLGIATGKVEIIDIY